MNENLLKSLNSLPSTPGVYQYFSSSGRLLYVGKAKDLKKRVRSYFSFVPIFKPNEKNSLRIQKMIEEASSIEFISTHSEADALILENSFIKQLRPKYNILLRDDKTYPYIYIDLNEDFPRFNITRMLIKKSKIRYFGPFFKGAKELLNALYLYFPLKQKNNCKSPCIFYQINRCKGYCVHLTTKDEYKKLLEDAMKALLNPSILVKKLEEKMLFLASNENYEEAARLRDQIKTIKDLEVKIELDLANFEDFEVFAMSVKNELLSTIRFVIQNGKIISSNSKITPLKMAYDKNEIYKQLILENFNANIPFIANKIYTYEDFEDSEILADILSKRFNKKIHIKTAKQGEKKRICELAFENSLQNINIYKKKENIEKSLQEYFGLENEPNCIEIFDNSHMQGVACVGAMVCFENGVFNKSHYRKFHLNYKNDYEQMREVLTRRIKDFDKLSPPDLWVLDGGKALLNLALNLIKDKGVNIDILAIAKEKIDSKAHRTKGRARDKIYSIKGEFSLNDDDRRLQFLQKLRDEAHRFAISFHQKTKKKQDLTSSKLLNLGITQGSLQKLLAYYGSFENIYKADFDELCKLTNKKTAQKISSLNSKF
ncbi:MULTISPECIES: excinuclease ABC subunit UvrC [unclassified Campylobacter]|uniref:excinuclease ABC subunit UvrC n=1 Tax=unclassified Campylobacter TaxID=2593542 RepID=UPI001237B3C3|nr:MULTISPECIES: excinuclease ABC subunit UvrC [unclassified Campylobacter]KAA6224982.1 excinuclease ABC subunit UvrC [Campylobacter sp. LR196d]KAA6225304.1 excinuclease ABC subunit UvrC [Campylobacter sp. LR286c]KAA6225577.1 excinuclease ABC subunit UvrC [Campylobacter sp. LR185c]KAA8604835.1 excinuclease ABC subunit C [Campylobacter sp. LR185c]